MVSADRLPAAALPRPFLKWAGGKKQLLPQIFAQLARLPAPLQRYHEPFLGGGAVFFALRPPRATLSDLNTELIDTYRAVRDEVENVIEALLRHRHCPQHFYAVRAQSPARLSPPARAARTIFLNRTCFNGLYRVNASGLFNVPFGRNRSPNLCDAANLRRVSMALQQVTLRACSAFERGRGIARGDLVYFDPPYDPVSPTASFVGYQRGGFGREQQARLRDMFLRLAARGVHVLLSNADTPFIRQLYRGCNILSVQARRAINRNAASRGPVSELLITAPPTRTM